MLLRSSSTPILGSLSSSSSSPFNESPGNNHHHHHQILEKASSLPAPSFLYPLKPSVCCHFSPLPDSSCNHDPPPAAGAGFRRVRSDGNLHSLLSSDHMPSPALYTIPSFSVYNSNGEEGERDEGEEGDEESDVIGEGISGGFSFLGQDQNLNLVEDSREDGSSALPLFLARGLGIDRLGSGLLNAGGDGGDGVGGGGGVRNGGGGGERSDVEMYYKRMVEENPSNALLLSNYAQFLYQTKGDAQRAEEYYSRAILADPGDGEILSQYARLVWELHHDKERAASYFEQAVRAAPNDSHVLGAFASFLWETSDDDGDGDGDGEEDGRSQGYFGVPVRHEVLA